MIVLVADKDIEHALRGMFSRPQALGIRAIQTDIFVHPQHDPACAQRGVQFLSGFSSQYKYALLMFDHEGCGREQLQPNSLEMAINEEFSKSAWGDRARGIVLAPELEVWIWSDSPHVDEVLGWKLRQPSLRRWLVDQGWMNENDTKPTRPKEAFESALRVSRIPRSASLFQQLAERVSLRQCTDTSFLQFRNLLQMWFPTLGSFQEH